MIISESGLIVVQKLDIFVKSTLLGVRIISSINKSVNQSNLSVTAGCLVDFSAIGYEK